VNGVFPERAEMQGVFGDLSKGQPVWVQGRWPQKDAVQFERDKQQAIVIATQNSLSLTYPITISTWVNFPNADQWGGHLISCRQNGYINYQFSLFDANYTYNYQKSRFEFRQYTGVKEDIVGFYSKTFVPDFQKWYHFGLVYDGDNLRFYVNGELFQATSYKGMSEPVPAEIIFGSAKKEGEYIFPKGDFDGIVDELMLFSRALSEQELRAIYQSGKP
jgi:hypothetical protein